MRLCHRGRIRAVIAATITLRMCLWPAWSITSAGRAGQPLVTADQVASAKRRTLLELIPKDRLLRKRGRGWITNCVFHKDKTPSMSLIKFNDGNWRYKCFGCGATGDPINYIQKDKGMSFVDAVKHLAGEAEKAPMMQKPVRSYDYYDTKGILLYQSCRYEPKTFKLRRPDEDNPGRWHWDMCGVQRVLYRLPDIPSKPVGTTVYYVEGEKDVESMEVAGFIATTHAGGAGAYRSELLAPIRHLRVVVVPDLDDPGKQLMRRVYADCRAAKMEVGFVLLPEQLNGKPVKDVTDYFAAGGTKDALEAMVK